MTMRWTIRSKLAALVVAALLPLVAGATCKFWRDLAHERADAGDDTAHGPQLDEVMSGQIEDLDALASVKRLDRMRDEDLRTLAARVRDPFVRLFYDGDASIIASNEDPVARSGAAGWTQA